jgi:hypothetical protein
VLDRTTLHTVEDKRHGRHQLHGKVSYQSRELLSYNLLTDIGICMEEGKSANGLHHSIFYSIMNDIMNWPFFLAFVTIDNDEEEDGK